MEILLVDDDVELAEMLVEFLASQDIRLSVRHTGPEGLTEASTGAYDLVLLDVMLPGMDGFEVLRRLRPLAPTPVVMLSARGDYPSRIEGLETGADDYVPKPFDPHELTARIRAVLRRSGASDSLEVAGLRLDPAARRAANGDTDLGLTSIEFDILEILVRQSGRLVSRDSISRKLYGRDAGPFDRSIDVHISHLRRKLGDRHRIVTVRGAGYQFAPEP
jgi:two-component system response regulator CpxR